MDQHQEAPTSITSARLGRSADIRKRQTRYLTSMGIRTVCFVLAIVVTGPFRWFLVAGAVVLPYVAVVLANATDRREHSGPPAFYTEERPLLDAPKESSTADDGRV